MDQAYVTLGEAAELEGVGYDTFQKKVRRNPEKYSAKLDQRDVGGRELVFVRVDSLSKKARDAYAERERVKELADAVTDAGVDEPPAIPWYVNEDVDYYREHHKEAWYKAMALCTTVRQFLEYSSKGRCGYAEKVAKEQTGKGLRTFYRYVKAYQEAAAWAYRLEKQDGCNYDHLKVLALCRKPKESGTFPSFTPEVRQAIKNIWFNKEFAANQGTREMLYDKLKQLQEINHWDKIPSYQSVVRYISYLMNEAGMKNAWYLASHGEREYKNKVMGKALRDATVLMPMEMVMGDEHTFDCWVSYTYPNGKTAPIKPVLVAWIDVRSRRVLGDVICHHANSDILKESLIKLINTPGCGVPKYLLIDNGKDYTAQTMTGVPRAVRNTQDRDYVDATGGFYYQLGIEDVHRALPYQPWTKTQVERFFGGVCNRFTRWLGSYTGTLTGSKTDAKIPKEIQKMHDRGELLTMEEFYERWSGWLHSKYEVCAHRGLKDAGETWTKPIELFENEERYYKPAPPKSAQLVFMYREDRVHIYNYGFRRFGQVYDAPELRLHKDETLTIRYDRHDVSHIFVTDLDGRPVCTAECRELLSFGDHVSEEALLKHIREQNRQLREDRERLREALVPFEEMNDQYVGFSSSVGGVELMIGHKPERNKVVSMPLDKAYRNGFRAESKDEPAEESEYLNRKAEDALKALRAL